MSESSNQRRFMEDNELVKDEIYRLRLDYE